MADFNALEMELNTKGTKVVYEVKHNEQVLNFIYEEVSETKAQMDAIVESYLNNFVISSTLENFTYKGNAIIENAII
jgi:phosphoribosylformylglycinamidine (FGAM) synthase PurS component